MEGGTVQFLVFLLIIILIKESWGINAATVDVAPRTLLRSGDPATITWAGITSPSEFDFLGVYTPPDSDHQNYIGWITLSSLSGWESGSGSLDIPLVNMRTPYQFRLFGGKQLNATTEGTPVDEDGDPLPTTDNLLAASLSIQFENFDEPTQIHLALTAAPTEMRVMFVTRDALESSVRYGPESSRLESSSRAAAETYQREQMCDSPANSSRGWRDPGIIYDAVMDNLQPGKRYFYQVGSNEGGWSEIYSFVLPDFSGDETNALLFGDMGTEAPYKTFLWLQEESSRTLKFLQKEIQDLGDTPVFISHIGDISYARGYEWLWDEFFHRIQPVAARVPYHVCMGNHEYDWPLQPWKPDFSNFGTDGGGECGVPYSLKFHMPGDSSLPAGNHSLTPATRNLYYSMSVGVVHFLHFCTEVDFLEGSDQYAFIEDDLSSVNRDKTPFVMVLGHRPMYTSDSESSAVVHAFKEKMIESLEPLLVKYRVNLVLWGHVHKYERTCPVANHACSGPEALNSSAQAPVHVVIGMAGQDWQPSWTPRVAHPLDPIYPQPEWSLYRGAQFGYARLHATRSLLTLSYVGNHDGQIHDVLEIFSARELELASPIRCHPGKWLWGFLCFVLAGLVGALLGSLLTSWRFRGQAGLHRRRSLKGAYVQVTTREDPPL